MKKTRIILILTLLLYRPVADAQTPLQQHHFAIAFFTGAHSQLITFAFVKTINGKVTGAEIVTKERFMFTALGHWPHPVNLKREDFFQKYNVDSCFLLLNDLNKISGYYAPVFDELWKIRFYEHPYQFDQMGWSQGQYKPSLYQSEFLKREYGLDNVLTDYLYGDSLFKLLRDVQTSGWIVEYRTASKDTTSAP